ncbi:MAG TPA: hypothetical protein VKB88_35495 [Bryobacteraceae bacterium]|nr:hypothetical protein [Bryobacteraceae bacterium]
MRGTRHSKEHIVAILKQAENGMKTAEVSPADRAPGLVVVSLRSRHCLLDGQYVPAVVNVLPLLLAGF